VPPAVSGTAGHGDGGPQQGGVRGAVDLGRGPHLREHGGGDAEFLEDVFVPGQPVDVEHHGAGGIGGVGGVDAAARQVPEQPGVHGAEHHLAPHGPLAQIGHFVEQPPELGPREIGIYDQPCPLAHRFLPAPTAQLVAEGGRTPALPDDGVVYRPAGGPFPDQGRLALVGDADCRDVLRPDTAQGDGLACGLQLGLPNTERIMFHPGGAGVDLRERAGSRRHGRQGLVEQDGARTGSALVEGKKVGHSSSPRGSRYGQQVGRVAARGSDRPHPEKAHGALGCHGRRGGSDPAGEVGSDRP